MKKKFFFFYINFSLCNFIKKNNNYVYLFFFIIGLEDSVVVEEGKVWGYRRGFCGGVLGLGEIDYYRVYCSM